MLLNPEHREEMGKILINSKDMIKNLVRGSAASFGFNPLLVEKFLEYSGPYVDKFVRRSAYLE